EELQAHLREKRSATVCRKGRRAQLSLRTIGHVLADVRCLFAYAVRSEVIVRSPWRQDIMPRVGEELPRGLSNEQVQAILAIAKPAQAFVIRLLLLTGMRWGELHGLLWTRVRLGESAWIELERTKSQ